MSNPRRPDGVAGARAGGLRTFEGFACVCGSGAGAGAGSGGGGGGGGASVATGAGTGSVVGAGARTGVVGRVVHALPLGGGGVVQGEAGATGGGTGGVATAEDSGAATLGGAGEDGEEGEGDDAVPDDPRCVAPKIAMARNEIAKATPPTTIGDERDRPRTTRRPVPSLPSRMNMGGGGKGTDCGRDEDAGRAGGGMGSGTSPERSIGGSGKARAGVGATMTAGSLIRSVVRTLGSCGRAISVSAVTETLVAPPLAA